MKILTIAEHYPSPFKSYHDAQFERFIADGHDLAIYAFGSHVGELNEIVRRHRLDRRTAYLPPTLKALPSALGRSLRSVILHPLTSAQRMRQTLGEPRPWKNRVLDTVRGLLLPQAVPDLLVIHNLRAQANMHFVKAIYPDAVVAFYYHGGEVPGVPSPPESHVVDAFARADIVCTNTESSKENAIGRGCAPEKIHVSPVGFNLDDFPDPVERDYYRDGILNLLMAGRFSKEKGMLTGVQAFHELVREGQVPAKLRIIGEGPERTEIERFISRERLDLQVEILGRVSQSTLLDEYRRADVVILPSVKCGTWEENQACVVQEAMLMRAIPVVSRTGGVPESTAPEILQYSFSPGNVAEMADALRRVSRLNPAELGSLGARGRNFAERRYDIRYLNADLIQAAMSRKPGDLRHASSRA